MFQTLRKLASISPFAFLIAAGSGCDVSNGTGPGNDQQPDPVVVDIPIAFIARKLPLDDDPETLGLATSENILDAAAFNPGARLVLKDRAKFSAPEQDLTTGLFPDQPEDPDDENSDLIPAQIDIKDLEVSPDGTKLVFALRAPTIEDDEAIQPTWNIWQYDRETETLSQILDPFVAEQGEDVSPHYLPDGRIVFSSTRQKLTKAILLDEGKSQYSGLDEDGEDHAFNLHTYNPDTGVIDQLTFNPSHDLQPTVLSNGRIAFLRWDNLPGHGQLSFYSVKPDGSDIQKLYGYNSQTTGPDASDATFWNARELVDGQLLINFRNRESRHWGGDIVTINTANFTDLNQPNPQNPGSGSPQKSLSPIPVNITEDDPQSFSGGGFYNSAFPLNDGTNRLLVSWSPCLINAVDDGKIYPCTSAFLSKSNIEPAIPTFGLWVLNLDLGTQQPLKPALAEINEVYTEAVALSDLTPPDNLVSNLDDTLAKESVGLVHIRNIYDIDGTMNQNVAPMPHLAPRSERPARFVRLVKAVPIPDDDVLDFDRNIAFGVNGNDYMRDILGYVPIEPDGSVKFKVPAYVAFSIELVDVTGKRLPNAFHENWLSMKPGEQFECVGCHATDSTLPHGRRDAQSASAYLGAPFDGTNLESATAPAVTGQSMAEYFADTFGPRTPSVDILYRDMWATGEADIVISYLGIAPNGAEFLAPIDPICTTEVPWTMPTQCESGDNPSPYISPSWTSVCRITINYEQHIQPFLERDRRVCDVDGDGVDRDPENNQDFSCANCHSDQNEGGVPAGSLYLTKEMPIITVPPEMDPTALTRDDNCNQNRSEDFFASYRQLLLTRLKLELVDGQPRPVYTSRLENEIDEDTGESREIIVRTCERVDGPASSSGAIHSEAFFSLFEGNDSIHTGILSPSELRLIAEWLDLGSQYYNNPFMAPLND